MSGDTSERDPVEALAEEFLERRRRGERPTIEGYAALHPGLAEEIRAVFPAMALVDDLGAGPEPTDPGTPPPTAGVPGGRVGEFRILREVGRGGMGVVFEAEQVSLGRRVALKLLPGRGRPDPRHRARFEREARAAGRLHHTNIVPVFGVGTHEGTPFYAMQFIDGWGLDAVVRELRRPVDAPGPGPGPAAVAGSLRTDGFATPGRPAPAGPATTEAPGAVAGLAAAAGVPARPRPASTIPMAGPRRADFWRGVARVGAQVADGLAYAHAQGVVHRDIKPSNILIDGRGTAWVADFGLAKTDDGPGLTETGDFLGTLRYMPPEAFEGKAGAPGDVYALGLTLYELIALRPAFDEPDRGRLIRAVTEGRPPRLRRHDPEVPRDLETVIHKAIEPDPSGRYASAADLAEDLRRFAEGRPVRARRAGEAERLLRWCRRNPAMAALASTLAALLVLTTAASLRVAAGFRDRAEAERGLAAANDVERRKAERALGKAERAGLEAIEARDQAVGQAHRASFSEAQALRLARTPGWRGRSLASLASLAGPGGRDALGRGPFEFRTEAVACLGEVDFEEVARLEGGRGGVRAIGFGPDAATLATLSEDGTLQVWDARAARALRSVATGGPAADDSPAAGPAPRFRYRPGPGPLAYLDAGGGVRWLGPAAPPRLAGGPAWALDFDREGGRVALGVGGRALVSRLPDGEVLLGQECRAPALALSPDGSRLATTRADNSAWVARVGGPAEASEVGRLASRCTRLAFSPDGRWLAAGDVEGTIRVWDVDSKADLMTLRGHDSAVHCLAFSPDGRWLASSGLDLTVRVREARGGRPIATIQPGLRRPEDVAFSPDGDLLAVGTGDGQAVLYAVRGRAELRRFEGLHRRVGGVAFDPARPRLYTAGVGGVVAAWDLASGEVAWRSKVVAGNLRGLAVSPDGAWLIAGRPGAAPPLLMRADGSGRPRPLLGHGSPARAMAFGPAGRAAATGGSDGGVMLHGVPDARPLWGPRRAVPDAVGGIGFAAGGRELLVGSAVRGLVALDARTGREARAVAVPGGVDQLAIAPGGGRAWACSGDRTLRAYRLPGLEEVAAVPTAHVDRVLAMAASPDGLLLATADGQGTVLVHDARDARPLFALPITSRGVAQVDFDPGSRYLAVCGSDFGVSAWDLGRIRSGLEAMGLGAGVPTPAAPAPPGEGLRPAVPRTVRPAVADAADAARASRELDARSERATGLLEAGDPAGYRGACEAALARLGGLGEADLGRRLARLCSLAPGAVADPSGPARLAEAAVAEAPPERAGDALGDLGAALARAGRPGDSIDALTAGIARRGGRARPEDRSFLALAHARLGRPAEARRQLGLGDARPGPEADRLEGRRAAILRREAEAAAWDGGFPADPFAR